MTGRRLPGGGEWHFNHAGAVEILNSAGVRAVIDSAAEQVADAARGAGGTVGAVEGGGEVEMPVAVESQTTDRARAVVSLAHPAGLAYEAKYGALTKAAASAGLEVKSDE